MSVSILLSIICAFSWSLQAIFLKLAMKKIPLYTTILITLTINFIVIIAFINIGSGFLQFYRISPSVYMYFILAGFLNYFLGRGFYYSSFRFISVTRGTSISSSYPILSVAFSIMVLGEKLPIHQFLGIGLTLTGVYLLMIRGKR